jgi:hypothetical protein
MQLTCKGTLQQVFICLRTPPPLTHCIRVYSILIHTEYIFLLEMKQGYWICPLSWSVHCNFTGDGKCNERGWACTRVRRIWLFLKMKNTDPLMGAKLKSKTHLQNTFFDFLSCFFTRLGSKFSKSANKTQKFFFSLTILKNAEFHADFESVEKVV